MLIKRRKLKKYIVKKTGGYILPAVLVASVVMMAVLVTGLSVTTAIRVSVKKQGYDKLTLLAKQAGIAYAKACVLKNLNNADKWTPESPLTPATNCDGTSLDGGESLKCNTDAGLENDNCLVLNDTKNNYRTSFSVDSVTLGIDKKITNINSTGILGFVRKTKSKAENKQKIWKKQTNKGGYTRKTVEMPMSWKQVSAGADHTCAIGSDDKAYCWGTGGRLGDGSAYNSYIPTPVFVGGDLSGKKILSISSGRTSSCAIDDGHSLYCWGKNTVLGIADNLPRLVASGDLNDKLISSVAVGENHACAIDDEGNAYCWGSNSKGQLGNNKKGTSSMIPVSTYRLGALTNVKFISIISGAEYSCAISKDKKSYCWGYMPSASIDAPVPWNRNFLGNTADIKSISTHIGSGTICVIANDETGIDQVYCLGSNSSGQLGNGVSNDYSFHSVAVKAEGALSGKIVKSVSVGVYHVCAVASTMDGGDLAYCWGGSVAGATGVSPIAGNLLYPTAVNTDEGVLLGKTISSLSAGTHHTCVITLDSQLFCWGSNSNQAEYTTGVLGNNSAKRSFVPAPISLDSKLSKKTVKSISTTGTHTCAVSTDGIAYCWGSNQDLELGVADDYLALSRIPYEVYVNPVNGQGLNGKTIKSIIVSPYFGGYSCAIAGDQSDNANQVYCWGNNYQGHLGVGSLNGAVSSPLKVVDGDASGMSIATISLGYGFTCSLDYEGQAYCWGDGSGGQLGNSLSELMKEPKKVKTIGGVLEGKVLVSISSSAYHTCALDSDGQAYCWGRNNDKELGSTQATGQFSDEPVVVNVGYLAGKKISAISAGTKFTCAIVSADKSVYCWGFNGNSNLGSGQNIESSALPLKVDTTAFDNKEVKSIASGINHSCLVTVDDKVYCWGNNFYGQLGDGKSGVKASRTAIPVKVRADNNSLAGRDVNMVSVGLYSTCIVADELPFCWGKNDMGQLGNNSTIDSLLPTPIFTSLTYLKDFETYR